MKAETKNERKRRHSSLNHKTQKVQNNTLDDWLLNIGKKENAKVPDTKEKIRQEDEDAGRKPPRDPFAVTDHSSKNKNLHQSCYLESSQPARSEDDDDGGDRKPAAAAKAAVCVGQKLSLSAPSVDSATYSSCCFNLKVQRLPQDEEMIVRFIKGATGIACSDETKPLKTTAVSAKPLAFSNYPASTRTSASPSNPRRRMERLSLRQSLSDRKPPSAPAEDTIIIIDCTTSSDDDEDRGNRSVLAKKEYLTGKPSRDRAVVESACSSFPAKNVKADGKGAPIVSEKLSFAGPLPANNGGAAVNNGGAALLSPQKNNSIASARHPSGGQITTTATTTSSTPAAAATTTASTATATAVYDPLNLPPPIPSFYTLEGFIEMWNFAAENQGLSTEEHEDSKGIRGGNQKVDAEDSSAQKNAQYGRILPKATQFLFDEVLQLDASRGDVVVDIGSGIGNFVMQAAMVCHCEARGIEVVESRYISSRFMYRKDLLRQRKKHGLERDNRDYVMGKTKFVHGRLEAAKHREFLTKPRESNGVIKAFCNNYNGVFAHRSARDGQLYMLDDFVAGLFALMPPGSILVTLHPLTLVLPRSKILSLRRKHGLVDCDDALSSSNANASFYEVEQILLGKAKDVVSWGSGCVNDIYVYKYSRLRQERSGDGTSRAVFQCWNPTCPVAQAGTAIPATKTVTVKGVKGAREECIVINACDCKVDGKPERSGTRKVSYKE